MSPAGIPHNYFLIQLNRIFSSLIEQYEVAIQATLPLDDGNVFDPDFMLLRRKAEGYKHAYPQPEEVLLLIEESQTSLQRDQEVKLPAYAAAGIQEYWIADLEQHAVIVHRKPVDNSYCVIETHRGEDPLTPLAAPAFSLPVCQLFE